jgi:diguanylate cyclase (GGDEF)-like protein
LGVEIRAGGESSAEDITDTKRAQEQLSRLAHYDPLTGLPNRLSLQQELGRLLVGCALSPVSIALFGLDSFKDVNDTLGHPTGDQLLIEVCQRFIKVTDGLARAAKVCRLGDDEFVIIVPDCGDPRVIAEIVDVFLKRLRDPFDVNGNVLHLGTWDAVRASRSLPMMPRKPMRSSPTRILRSIRPKPKAATAIDSSFRHCAPACRRGARLVSSSEELALKASSNSIFNRRSGSPTTP